MIDKKKKQVKQADDERKHLERERAKLTEVVAELVPLQDAIQAVRTKLAGLPKSELAEPLDYFAEAAVGPEAQAVLDIADAELAEARRALSALSSAELEYLRATETPSAPLRVAVEAVCVLMELKPDFGHAQARLMRTTAGLTRRLLAYQSTDVPKVAPARIRRLFGDLPQATNGCEGAPPPPADETESEEAMGLRLARVLRKWVEATLAHDAATAEARCATEEVVCSVGIAAACEAVADLYGLVTDDDLKGVLQLAIAYPESAKSGATDGNDGEDRKNEGAEASQAQIAACEALEKAHRLRGFLSLAKSELVAIGQSARSQRDSMRLHADALTDRASWSSYISDSGSTDTVVKLSLSVLRCLLDSTCLSTVPQSACADARARTHACAHVCSPTVWVGATRSPCPRRASQGK